MGFFTSVESKIESKIAEKAKFAREVELSLNIAKARDSLMIFGGVWSTFVTGVTLGKLAGKPVPGVVGIPIVIGGIFLANMADLA